MRRLSFAIACLLLCQTLSAAEPIKVLLICGGCCHDYTNQKRIISEGLSQRGNFAFTIIHEGDDKKEYEYPLYEHKDWAKGFDLIIHDECFGATTNPELVQRIVQAHFDGVPAVFIHCAMHSYRGSGAAEAWRELIGVTSTSHEKARAENVVKLDVDHPVLIGFPKTWTTPNGELYKIDKVWPNCTPLAIAFGPDTMKDHSVIWVNTFHGTKVFGTTLGHHNETMNTDIWLDLVSRGALWTVGKLGDDGKPLPGYAGTGVKPIEIAPPKPVPETNLPKK
jgi:type 1 glutamine amidotransferase